MKTYNEMTTEELQQQKELLLKKYKDYQDMNLKLSMARGNPSPEQLALTMPMLDVLNSSTDCMDGTVDARNYGCLLGIPSARKLFAEYMGVTPEETIVVGNASLNFMYDCLTRAMLFGVLGSEKPWKDCGKIKFLCPVPGYDRHFTICEALGIEMIPVPLTEWGPDMDLVRELVKDEQVKGMWIVPKYTNPYGGCYSDDAIKQLAALEPAAKDFRIFCDNAYAVHYIYKDVPVLNLLNEAKKVGHENMIYMFGSTSKITFAGAGVGFFAGSEANVKYFEKQLNVEIISWDKMNQLRHVLWFKDAAGIHACMDKHAELLRPRFDAVLNALDKHLAGKGAGTWVKPDGGYFVTFMANKGCATRINQLCKEAGVVMTPAGATHPYHKDPDDSFLRIAPSFPSVQELEQAIEIFCIAAQIATIEVLEAK